MYIHDYSHVALDDCNTWFWISFCMYMEVNLPSQQQLSSYRLAIAGYACCFYRFPQLYKSTLYRLCLANRYAHSYLAIAVSGGQQALLFKAIIWTHCRATHFQGFKISRIGKITLNKIFCKHHFKDEQVLSSKTRQSQINIFEVCKKSAKSSFKFVFSKVSCPAVYILVISDDIIEQNIIKWE